MTSPINSFQDILDALEKNPSLRDPLRRHILTEELLHLPAQFVLLRADVDELKSGQERFEARVDQLAEGQQRLESNSVTMGGTLSRLDGTSYENHAVNLAPRTLRRQLNISDIRIVAHGDQMAELRDITLSPTTGGRISDAEANQLQSADLIVSGTNQNGNTTYVLAEISIVLQHRVAGQAQFLSDRPG